MYYYLHLHQATNRKTLSRMRRNNCDHIFTTQRREKNSDEMKSRLSKIQNYHLLIEGFPNSEDD